MAWRPQKKIVPEATGAGETKLSIRTNGPARGRYWLTVLRWTQTNLAVPSLETWFGASQAASNRSRSAQGGPPWESRLPPPRDRSGETGSFLLPWSECHASQRAGRVQADDTSCARLVAVRL